MRTSNGSATITGTSNGISSKKSVKFSTEETKEYKWDIVWINVIGLTYSYVASFYAAYLLCTCFNWPTFLWSLFLTVIGTLGATAGAHRLWTHNTYKAKLPLRIVLAIFQATCYQNSLYVWIRDHRMHHKYSDTDADPHNAARGFIFSHVGWLMVKKHKDVIEKGKTIYLKDIEADPVVMYQKKFFWVLMPLCCFVIPCVVPWYFWNESFMTAWYIAAIGRYTLNVNGTWLVNSAAHLYGTRPYDLTILPKENVFVGYVGMGEGWHNYHHAFPWDYKASEFNGYAANLTTGFLDLCAYFGWAYDLKSVPEEMIRKRIARTGVHNKKAEDADDSKQGNDKCIWGWDDEEMSTEDKNETLKLYATN